VAFCVADVLHRKGGRKEYRQVVTSGMDEQEIYKHEASNASGKRCVG
jgi:hypothetical protein